MKALGALLLGASIYVLAMAGCDRKDVVLAELTPLPDGGYLQLQVCIDDEDCPHLNFCSRRACEDVAGHCELLPVFCDSTIAPVCGCDGITYWNECVMRANGASERGGGECTTSAMTCDTQQPCEHGVCARLHPAQRTCMDEDPGSCWVLPPECPDDDRPAFEGCGSTPGSCAGACAAIRSERPYRALATQKCPG